MTNFPFPISKDQEPLPIPGGWAIRRFDLGARELAVWVPACPEAFLEDADSIAAHGPSAERPERSDIPFWQYLWPAAEAMARLVLAHDWTCERQGASRRSLDEEPAASALPLTSIRPAGHSLGDAGPLSALELGAGVGLVGLAGLARGLRVTFTDYQEPALIAAAANARLNGFTGFETELLDWHAPGSTQYPIVLGCEVIYERAIHEPILNVLDSMLSPQGVAWLGDPGRSHVPAFLEEAERRGYHVEIRNAENQPLPAPIFGEFQLLILRH